MKNDWYYYTGEIIVKIKAIDDNDRFQTFEIRTYRSKEVNDYDFGEALTDLARISANLHNCYRPEIIKVERV